MSPEVPRPKDPLTQSGVWHAAKVVGRLPSRRIDQEKTELLEPLVVWEAIKLSLEMSERNPEWIIDLEEVKKAIGTAAVEREIESYLNELEKYCQANTFFLYDPVAIRQAMILAAVSHARQKRKTGEPYIIHPRAVSFEFLEIMKNSKDPESPLLDLTENLCILLNHDIVEDAPDWLFIHQRNEELTEAALGTREAIKKDLDGARNMAGTPVRKEAQKTVIPQDKKQALMLQILRTIISERAAIQVAVLTKFSKRHNLMRGESPGYKDWKDTLDFITLLVDILDRGLYAVIPKKISDRLNNIRTLDGFIKETDGTEEQLAAAKNEQREIALKTLVWYAALAAAFGFKETAQEIEDLCLPYIFSTEFLAPYKKIWDSKKIDFREEVARTKNECGKDQHVVVKEPSFAHAFVAFLENLSPEIDLDKMDSENFIILFSMMVEHHSFPGRRFCKIETQEAKPKKPIRAGSEHELQIKINPEKIHRLKETLVGLQKKLLGSTDSFEPQHASLAMGEVLREMREAAFGTPAGREQLHFMVPTVLREFGSNKGNLATWLERLGKTS